MSALEILKHVGGKWMLLLSVSRCRKEVLKTPSAVTFEVSSCVETFKIKLDVLFLFTKIFWITCYEILIHSKAPRKLTFLNLSCKKKLMNLFLYHSASDRWALNKLVFLNAVFCVSSVCEISSYIFSSVINTQKLFSLITAVSASKFLE